MKEYAHFWFEASDGEKVFMHVWDNVESPKGIVQIIHGMAEHGKRYEDFALFLNRQGYIVYADDHRAHGKTAKKVERIGKMKSSDFMRIVQDEIEISEMIKKKYKLPLYLVGHSFGSFITQRYIIERSDLTEKVVLVGSGSARRFQSTVMSWLSNVMVWLKGEYYCSPFLEKCVLGSFDKRIPDAKTPYDWVCKNEEVLEKYSQDPFCGAVFSIGYYNGLAINFKKMYTSKFLSKIKSDLPIFIVAGSEDPVGEYGKALERLILLYKKNGIRNVHSKFYEGMRHEILNEQGKREVYNDIHHFLTNTKMGEM